MTKAEEDIYGMSQANKLTLEKVVEWFDKYKIKGLEVKWVSVTPSTKLGITVVRTQFTHNPKGGE